jgi:hypothetical protein
LGLLLIAPLTSTLTERRRRARRWEARKTGSDLLLHDWTRVVMTLGMGYVHLSNAIRTADSSELSRIAHDGSGRGMEWKNMTLAEIERNGQSTASIFKDLTSHLDRAEREFLECQDACQFFFQETAVLASAVEPEELAGLMLIQGNLGEIRTCARSVVDAIRVARLNISAERVVTFDHLACNRNVKQFLSKFSEKGPEDPWLVRVLDRVMAQRITVAKTIEQITGEPVYVPNPSPALSEEQWIRTADVLAVPEKVVPSVDKQNEFAQWLLAPQPQYRAWIADFERWADELRSKMPSTENQAPA